MSEDRGIGGLFRQAIAAPPPAFIMLCGLQLVPLHQVDGRVILVNPNEITAVATPRRGDQKLGNSATACMVFMTDHTHWQVLETCAAIKQLIEK